MATSRTGTASWKKLAAQAKRLAQAQGQTKCPYPLCGVTLNYHHGLTPASAEPDHIIPHANGGTDTLDNLRITCRRCNQSKGQRQQPKRATTLKHKPLKTSRNWNPA